MDDVFFDGWVESVEKNDGGDDVDAYEDDVVDETEDDGVNEYLTDSSESKSQEMQNRIGMTVM